MPLAPDLCPRTDSPSRAVDPADVCPVAITRVDLDRQRDDMSTYAYDYTSNRDDCPSSSEKGTLESQAGVGTTEEWDYSIATLNPGGPIGQDLSLQIIMAD